MEMTGRMESVENLGEQRRGFASQRQVSHPSHRPLEIAKAIPTFPQPRRRYSDTYLQTTKPRGHFYWASEGDISIGLRHKFHPGLRFASPWATILRRFAAERLWARRPSENGRGLSAHFSPPSGGGMGCEKSGFKAAGLLRVPRCGFGIALWPATRILAAG